MTNEGRREPCSTRHQTHRSRTHLRPSLPRTTTTERSSMKRHRDPGALLAKMLSDRQCRGCGGEAVEAHHIVLRSAGGDDVMENIMPLCGRCHDQFHAEGHLAASLSWGEVCYAWRKLGVAALSYLERRYEWTQDAAS